MKSVRYARADLYPIKANILVKQNGRACLADFGLLTIASDATKAFSNSSLASGTFRWMAPELFYPEKFGLMGRRLTKSSDCYALGMVIYEVLSGKIPFHRYNSAAAIVKIVNGARPERPQGVGGLWFTDVIWNTLERCWNSMPDDRPSAEEVLRCLEKASMTWSPGHTIACLQTTDPATPNLDSDTGESTEESETPTASQTTQQPDLEDILRRLVGGGVPHDELPSLIETIVLNLKAADIFRHLQESDAQAFIDVIDHVCYGAALSLRHKCVANFSPVRRFTALASPNEFAKSV